MVRYFGKGAEIDRPKQVRVQEDEEFTYQFGRSGLTPIGRTPKTTAHQYNDFLRKIDCKDVYRPRSDFEKSMNINAGEVCWSNYIDRMEIFLDKKYNEMIKRVEDDYDFNIKTVVNVQHGGDILFSDPSARRQTYDRDPSLTVYNLAVVAQKKNRKRRL